MTTHTHQLNDTVKVTVVTESTSLGTVTRKLIVDCSDENLVGITTATLREITSSILRPNTHSDNTLPSIDIPLPTPDWNEKLRHSNITLDQLKVIADVYHTALRLGYYKPTKFVQIWLNTSKPTASRYVRRARDAGLIGRPIKKGLPSSP